MLVRVAVVLTGGYCYSGGLSKWVRLEINITRIGYLKSPTNIMLKISVNSRFNNEFVKIHRRIRLFNKFMRH